MTAVRLRAGRARRHQLTHLRAAGAELGQQTSRDLCFFLQIKTSKGRTGSRQEATKRPDRAPGLSDP